MTAKLAFILLLSTLRTPLLRQHKNRAYQSVPIRQREAWVPVDSEYTITSYNNALITHWTLLTLRTIFKAENCHLENDKPSGHPCMDEHRTSEWRSSKLTARCARVSSYFAYFGTSQHFLSLELQRGKWIENPKILLPVLWHFQWSWRGGESDPIGLKLGTSLSYGNMYLRLQVQPISINLYREWKMIATFTFVHGCRQLFTFCQ